MDDSIGLGIVKFYSTTTSYKKSETLDEIVFPAFRPILSVIDIRKISPHSLACTHT